jgi:hypothetical protein
MLIFSVPPMRPARGNFIRAYKILRLFVEPVTPKRTPAAVTTVFPRTQTLQHCCALARSIISSHEAMPEQHLLCESFAVSIFAHIGAKMLISGEMKNSD